MPEAAARQAVGLVEPSTGRVRPVPGRDLAAEHGAQAAAELTGIAGRDQLGEPGRHLPQDGDVRGHDRRLHRHRLEQRAAEALEPGREGEQVGGDEQVGHVGAVAEEAHARTDAERRHDLAQLGGRVALAAGDEEDAHRGTARAPLASHAAGRPGPSGTPGGPRSGAPARRRAPGPLGPRHAAGRSVRRGGRGRDPCGTTVILRLGMCSRAPASAATASVIVSEARTSRAVTASRARAARRRPALTLGSTSSRTGS